MMVTSSVWLESEAHANTATNASWTYPAIIIKKVAFFADYRLDDYNTSGGDICSYIMLFFHQ